MPRVYDDATMARFEREFTDLQALCADRPLVTSEIFVHNDAYGGARILKAFARMDEGTPIRAILPHGVYHDELMYDWEADSLLPAALVFPAYRERSYRERGIVPVPSAAPFVYADRLVTYKGPRNGTLFFPSHSTDKLTVIMDFEALAEGILALPEWMKPVTVMGYWRDIQLGHHEAFLRRGMRVVSAGHIHDPDFLLRLAHLLKHHKHAASNGSGSHLFYSLWAGCTFLLSHQPYARSGADRDVRLQTARPSSALQREFLDFRSSLEMPTREADPLLRETAGRYLGAEYSREPEELRDLIRWLARLDRFGGAVLAFGGHRFADPGGRPPNALVPYAWRRWRRDWFVPRLAVWRSAVRRFPMAVIGPLYRRSGPLKRLWRRLRDELGR